MFSRKTNEKKKRLKMSVSTSPEILNEKGWSLLMDFDSMLTRIALFRERPKYGSWTTTTGKRFGESTRRPGRTD